MTLYKKSAADDQKVEVAEYVYVCESCDYTEIFKKKSKKDKKCPKCKSSMTLVGNRQD